MLYALKIAGIVALVIIGGIVIYAISPPAIKKAEIEVAEVVAEDLLEAAIL
jgi:hypothetical protein